MSETVSSAPAAAVPLIDGLGDCASAYRVLLCDIWGVIHNGVDIYEAAADALTRFRKAGGLVVLISNSPRPSPGLVNQLDALGFPRSAYDQTVTSGDATRSHLSEAHKGAAAFHIGPERDLPLFDGLDLERTGLEEASLIVCTGLHNDETETPDDYDARLTACLEKRLPMVCANPDVVVERGDKLIYCAGALAERYEAMGGKALLFGKPYAPIYKRASRLIESRLGGHVAPAHILAVGDGISTDIEGARRQGIPALFVTGGIAADELGPSPDDPDAAKVAAFCADHGQRPVAAMPRLAW